MVNCEKVPDVQWTLHSRSTRVLYDSQSNALCSHTHYTKEWIPYRLNKATNCILFTLKLTGQCWEEREVYDVLFSVQNVSWLVRINHVKGVVSLNTVSEGPVGFVDNAAFAFGPMGCSHIWFKWRTTVYVKAVIKGKVRILALLFFYYTFGIRPISSFS